MTRASRKALPNPKGQRTLLRVFFGEKDKHEGKLLHLAVLESARRMGIAGCTAYRGVAGFGAGGTVHAEFPPDTAIDLPILIEVVDTREKTAALLKEIEPLLGGALVTEETLRFHHHGRGT